MIMRQNDQEEFEERYRNLISGAIGFALFSFAFFLFAICSCRGAVASWYGEEYRGYPMANGQPFDPQKPICASWHYKFGTRLKVTNLDNGKSTIVTCLDRGPAKRLVRQGRVIDLSESSFAKIADTNLGLIRVRIRKL